MGQIKKFDKVGFQSRADSRHFDISYWKDFVSADKMLVDIDDIIAESGIEGVSPIGYVSRANKIDQLCHDACVLINYPQELEEELISVDTLFSSNVHDEALNDLATIKIDDIKIRNTFDVTITQRYEHIEYEDPSETYLKEYLTLSDFVGSFDGLKSQETSYVKGFTDLLYSPYMTEGKDLHEIVAEKNDEIYEILYGAEFDVKRHQPGKEALSEIFGLVTIGLFSLAKAYMGYDPITGEILTEEERTALAISGTVTASLFIFTMGTSGGAGEALVTYMSIAGGGSASILTEKACEEMGASQLETFLFSSLAGILVGYSIAKAGNSCLEFYRNNRQQVLKSINEQPTINETRLDQLSTPSSRELRNNMIEAGIEVPDYPNAAHHIVAGNSPKAAESRAIMQMYGVDINEAENGVFLPTVRGVSEGAYHPSLHTNSYYDRVNNLLREATCKEDVLDILEFIGEELKNGTFMK